jgi:glycosyltransferase involved in cell wall biosynthesis
MTLTSSIKTEPLVSVVIPVYNGDKYFEKCLESVQNQTYRNWECIINNNCSKDNTLEVAERFAKNDKRFKIFSNDTFVKMVRNWNIGCSRISDDTKYLKVLGADDWLFPECIEKMVEVLDKNPSVGVCSSYRLNDQRVDMDGLNIWDGNVFDGKAILQKQLTRQLDISGSNSTVMFSVYHLKKSPRFPFIFDEGAYHMDTELVYEMMNISDVGFVFQVLSYTRRHEKAHTTTEGIRYKTLYQFKEKILFEYKGQNAALNKMYKDIRQEYAYFLLCRRLKLDTATINWHKNYIVREFEPGEYILGVLKQNKLSRFISKLVNRFLN